MRCAVCGAVNEDSAFKCKSCGEPFSWHRARPAETPAGGLGDGSSHHAVGSRFPQASRIAQVHHHDIARKWKFEYSFGAPDQTARGLEVISAIVSHLERPHIDLRALLDEAAALISKHFSIREVTIGLKDRKDGLLRYVSIVGIREEAEKALRRLAYTVDDFRTDGRYKGTSLGKQSALFLAEDNPYVEGEENTYSHPVLLGSRRKSLTDSIEGDYIDVMIFGKGDEIIGWIEIAGTRAGKIPDVPTIRWIELISKIIGAAIICKGYREAHI